MVEILHTYGNDIIIVNATHFEHDAATSMFIVHTTSGNKVYCPVHSVAEIGCVVETDGGYVYE